MNTSLEIIKPLSPAESVEWMADKSTITKTAKHIEKWVEAVKNIRDKQLYRDDYGTFEEFCTKFLKRNIRTVQLTLQLEDVRIEAQSSAPKNDQQTRALLANASANAIAEVAKVPKKKRASVFNGASQKAGGKAPTAKQVKEEAARQGHRRGGFIPATDLPPLKPSAEARDNSGAYGGSKSEEPAEHVCKCGVCGRKME